MGRKRAPGRSGLGEGLRKAARRTAGQAAKGIAEGTSVHGTRRALKFLHSLLVLIRPAIGEDIYGRETVELRRVAKALAAVRRESAMTEMAAKLDKIAKPGPEADAAAAFGQAATRLAGEAGKADKPDAAALSRIMRDFAKRIASWPLPPNDPSLYIEGAKSALRRARRRIHQDLSARDIDKLHSGRKALIHHLHHLQLLGELRLVVDDERIAKIEKLRGALGDMNDLDEAEALLREKAQASDPAVDRRALRKVLARRRRNLLGKAKRLTDSLLAEKPGAFAKRVRVAVDASLVR